MRDEKLWANERSNKKKTNEMRILPIDLPLPTGFWMNIYAVQFQCKFSINVVDEPKETVTKCYSSAF